MSRNRTAMAFVFFGVFAVIMPTAHAAEPVANSAAADHAPAAHQRDEKSILADLRGTKEKLDAVMPTAAAIADPDFRKQEGATVRPLLQQSADLLVQLAAAQKNEAERHGLEDDRCQYLAMLAALGDDGADAALAKVAAAGGDSALAANSAIALGHWWRGSKDAAAQQKILAGCTVFAKANPASDKVVMTLAVMALVGPASDEMSLKVCDVLRKVMTSDKAKKIAAELDPGGAQRELVGKPLVAAGRTSDGKKLSTADWTGKVVLIDFWATWCGPCNAEIPRVKDLYKTYHAKGFEIVGVDCDSSDDTVNPFVKKKEMPWPQLRDESQTDSETWHPLAKQWGVAGIPTMFLLDKKGMLRFIDAREDTAAKIEQLLAE